MFRVPSLKITPSLFSFVALASCSNVSVSGFDLLTDVSLKPREELSAPSLIGRINDEAENRTAQDWTDYKPRLLSAFLGEQYGRLPDQFKTEIGDAQPVTAQAYDGLATVEYYPLNISLAFADGETFERTIRVALAKPNAASGPVPVILKMDFCPFSEGYQVDGLPDGRTEIVVPRELIDADLPPALDDQRELSVTFEQTCQSNGGGLIEYSLGRYHETPPVREAIEKGYAFASIYVFDLVVDNPETSRAQLAHMASGFGDDHWGTIAAWAFQYSRAIDLLSGLPEIDGDRLSVYGHSRFGKAALLATAIDERIDLVIAHQSGRLGASLTRSEDGAALDGEPLAELVSVYPHWVSPKFEKAVVNGNLSLSFDQHALLAMIAPRPLLLGNGRRDRWSDPASAFAAASEAGRIYELFGASGFTATRLDEFDPDADIAFWIRGGTHGETLEDWNAFFEFLDRHFRDGPG